MVSRGERFGSSSLSTGGLEMNRCGDRPLLLVARIVAFGLSLVLSGPPAEAHNGRVALVVPLEGIVVDGDLSDWPKDRARYPILLPEYGVRPRDREDFEGSFRIGYSERENILYIAVGGEG